PRLTLGLLNDLMSFNTASESPGWRLAQDLHQRGLLDLHSPDKPRASQAISIPALVWEALNGEGAGSEGIEGSQNGFRLLPPLRWLPCQSLASAADLTGLLPETLLQRLLRLPDLHQKQLCRGVILRGMQGSGRLRAVGAIAHSLNAHLIHIQKPELKALPQLCRLVGPLALLHQAMPVIELELGPGEVATLPELAGYDGPCALLLGRDGSLSGPLAENCLTLTVPAPRQAARYQQWTQVIDPSLNGTRTLIETASRHYHLTLGAIQRAGHLAHAYAALNGHDHVAAEDIQAACCSLNQQTLDNLATRLEPIGTWDHLIVSDRTRRELETLRLRCRHRETLLDRLGPGFGSANRGLRAMFSGTSGTGKTLAARILAAELGLDLYRVELSSVVSKYIGETERNLSRLFARAEEQDVLLLLDEGDSLLTARTDVRSATDRYANLETNYLLQRLEQYEGIILITTNAANRVDNAFQRRIDVVIEFSSPDASQRQRLWQLHLPASHTVSPDFLRQAALRCQLTGGQIRNAALHATLLAVEADEPLRQEFLLAGIQREYTKMGAASPLN
ncbi:MAG: AAA family ATPase, partial [Cyanobacteria bacterium J06639_14]